MATATATKHATIVGVFDTRESAHRAVEELHAAGFRDHQITMVAHHNEKEAVEVTDLDAAKAAQVSGETRAERGAVYGAVAGLLIGGAIATAVVLIPGLGPVLVAGTLIAPGVLAGVAAGAVGGAVGGSIVGALVGLDLPEEHARLYERELKAGRVLVGVRAGDRADEVEGIIRRNGGHDPVIDGTGSLCDVAVAPVTPAAPLPMDTPAPPVPPAPPPLV